MNRKTVLTIAGSDSSGGAGIQADLKTMTALGLYGMSVITALTAQNTTGVYSILDVEPEFVARQMDCVFQDIFPDAIKIGMVSRPTSGSRLLKEEAVDTLCSRLLPLAALATPNIPEAEILSGHPIENREQMETAAREISGRFGTAVLVKGGHHTSDADDVLCMDGKIRWFYGRRIDSSNTHGTGCTLSSAIACGLAKGLSMEESISQAKEYLSGALASGLDLGKGSGPLDHCYLTDGRNF